MEKITKAFVSTNQLKHLPSFLWSVRSPPDHSFAISSSVIKEQMQVFDGFRNGLPLVTGGRGICICINSSARLKPKINQVSTLLDRHGHIFIISYCCFHALHSYELLPMYPLLVGYLIASMYVRYAPSQAVPGTVDKDGHETRLK
jgi:hypothetical protein